MSFRVTSKVGNGGGSGGNPTDLGYIPSPSQGTITSSTGSSAVIPVVNSDNAGLMTPAEKDKLDNLFSTPLINTGGENWEIHSSDGIPLLTFTTDPVNKNINIGQLNAGSIALNDKVVNDIDQGQTITDDSNILATVQSLKEIPVFNATNPTTKDDSGNAYLTNFVTTGTPITKGTATENLSKQRIGNHLIMIGNYEQTAAGVDGTGDYGIGIIDNLNIDLSIAPIGSVAGFIQFESLAQASSTVTLLVASAISVVPKYNVAFTKSSTNNTGNSGKPWNAAYVYDFALPSLKIYYKIDVPIQGWQIYQNDVKLPESSFYETLKQQVVSGTGIAITPNDESQTLRISSTVSQVKPDWNAASSAANGILNKPPITNSSGDFWEIRRTDGTDIISFNTDISSPNFNIDRANIGTLLLNDKPAIDIAQGATITDKSSILITEQYLEENIVPSTNKKVFLNVNSDIDLNADQYESYTEFSIVVSSNTGENINIDLLNSNDKNQYYDIVSASNFSVVINDMRSGSRVSLITLEPNSENIKYQGTIIRFDASSDISKQKYITKLT